MAGGQKKKKMNPWLPILAAFLIPGAGHVLLGQAKRGLLMVFWVAVFGMITLQLSDPGRSFVGRFAGGFAIWVLSILDVARMSRASLEKEGR